MSDTQYATRPLPQSNSVPPGLSSDVHTTPIDVKSGLNSSKETASSVSSQAASSGPRAKKKIRPIENIAAEVAPHMTPAALDIFMKNVGLARQNILLAFPGLQGHKWAATGQQHGQPAQAPTSAQPAQVSTPAQNNERQKQFSSSCSESQHPSQHREDRPTLPSSHAAPSLPPTLQQTPKQLLENSSIKSAYPQLQKSITSGFINTTEQFTPKPRQPEVRQPLAKIASLPPVQVPQNHRRTTPHPAPQIPTAALSYAEARRRNEIAEQARLERERKNEAEQRAKEREELLKDPSAIYHSYIQVLEFVPLRYGQQRNPYLDSLLANQPLPHAEWSSDRGLAVRYAKKHWESYLTVEDQDFAAKRAKAEKRKNQEEREGVDGHAAKRRRV
ncbi:hypothetical protein C7974DRAFT_413349 [Boeremia exigua]|uniref:uncharacterized protein n=1 Tax=Boeremia exigua TaxID=749465 RepID=UPI001E8CF912|nr:uncharacterized protein C7974DRAFT_413349 [Boeremia exigua]KAH6629562.1 hypothetical protein C7974DRAFT_413349 [Boeremia exigua]